MAEISLKQYLAKLDTLLQDNAVDEAIYNARHVIEHQPKNLAAHRKLARALLQKAAWRDAEPVLRRIVSLMPDDYEAHLGLGETLQHLKKPDEAIWHLERAFEQDPNNRQLIDALREMYRKHRSIEQAKIPLTTGAVARQYARNGLFDQAINTLQRTLTQSPDRLDLRLLLTRILRESGRDVEAAEAALDVLARLPDCLEANLVLGELWLNEQRPSDAQRYLSRIEAVDPYMALTLAQGSEPDEDVVLIPELDYQEVARRDLTAENPDWLLDINDTAPRTLDDELPQVDEDDFGDLFDLDDLPDAAAVRQMAEVPVDKFAADDLDLLEMTDDWLMDEPEQGSAAPASATVTPEVSDWLAQFADVPGDAAAEGTPPVVRRAPVKTGMLSRLEVEEAESKQQAQPEPAAPPPPAAVAVDFDDLFGDDDADLLEIDDNAIGWLDITSETAAVAPPKRVTGDLEDPLAWMSGSDVELVDTPVSTRPRDLYLQEDIDVALPDADKADPLAWMRTSGVEILDDEPPAPLNLFDDADFDDDALTLGADDHALSWLRESGVPVEEPGTSQAAPAPRATSTAPVVPQPARTWAATEEDDSLLDEMMALEALTMDTSSEAEPPARPSGITDHAATAAQERQGKMDNEDFASWFDEDDDETSEQEDSLAWLNAAEDDLEEPATPAAGAPRSLFDDDDSALDWMREPESEDEDVQPALNLFDEGELEWDEDLTPTADAPAGVPDWLSSVEASDSALLLDEDDAPAQTDSAPAWMAAASLFDDDEEDDEDGDSEQFAWTSELETETEDEEAEASGVPDWLSHVNAETPEAESFALEDTDESEDEDEDIFAPSMFAPAMADTAAEDDDADEFDWGMFEQETPAAQSVTDDTPSWLGALSFGDEDEAEEDAEVFALEGTGESDDEDEDEDIFAPSMFAPAMADAEADDDADELDWGMFEQETPAAQSVTDDTPSWLGALSFGDEDEAEEDAEVFALEGTGESDDEDEDEDIFAPSMFAPAMADAEAEDDDADELDWGMFEQETPAAQSVTDDTPSWLGALSFGDEDEAEEDAEVFALEGTGESDDEDEDEDIFAPSMFAPAMADTEAEDDDADELDWGMFEQEAPAAQSMTDDTPSWLGALSFGDEDEAEEDAEVFALEGAGESDDEDEDEDIFAPSMFEQAVIADLDDEDDDGLDWDLFVQEDAPEPGAGETPSWLGALSADADEAEDTEIFALEDVDEDKYQDEDEDEDEDIFAPSMFAPSMIAEEADSADADELDWGMFDRDDAATEDLGQTAAVPDWMSALDVDEDAETAPELYGDDAESVFAAEDDVPDWLVASAPVMTQAEMPVAFDAFDDVAEAEPDDLAPEAEAVGAAPDWLNAMVPGLDVDYEAEQDVPLEHEFIQRDAMAPAMEAPAREFGWLNAIVREEMRQPPTLPETPGVSVKRRFDFSRPPAWLRRMTERGPWSKARTAAAAEPLDVDQLGDELPPWLSYDDDDDMTFEN